MQGIWNFPFETHSWDYVKNGRNIGSEISAKMDLLGPLYIPENFLVISYCSLQSNVLTSSYYNFDYRSCIFFSFSFPENVQRLKEMLFKCKYRKKPESSSQ